MNLPNNQSICLKELFTPIGVIGDTNQFSNAFVTKLAFAYFEITEGKNYVLSYDMRTISKDIVNCFILVAEKLGVNISCLGITSIEHLLFSIKNGNYDGGIIISPNTHVTTIAGIRFFEPSLVPINIEALFDKFNKTQSNKILPKNLKPIPIISHLKDYFFNTLKIVEPINWKNHKIIIDGGNGLGAEFLISSLEKIPQLQTISIYKEPNSFFPHHLPDTRDSRNMSELSRLIIETQSDLGIILNHDGDEIVFLDDKGQIINSSFLGSLITKIILENNPQAKIGYTPQFKWAVMSQIKNDVQGIPLKSNWQDFFQISRELELDFSFDVNGLYLYKDSNYSINNLLTICLVVEYLSKKNIKLSEEIINFSNNIFMNKLYFSLKPETDLQNIKVEFGEIFESASFHEDFGMSFDEPNYHAFIENISDTNEIIIYLESKSGLLNNDIITRINNKLQNFAQPTQTACNKFDIICPQIEKLSCREKFEILLKNFWFTWNPHHILPIIEFYGDGWRKNLPPEALISNYGKDKLTQLLSEKDWELSQNLRIFYNYLENKDNFNSLCLSNIKFQIFETKPIAYFCMEFGYVDWLQIYSGGLGILAADYVKQASDMGIPVIGIGIFYHQGYLHQDFGPDGNQLENYIHQDPMDYNMELAKDEDGEVIVIELQMGESVVNVRAWKQMVGKNVMYLLDTNFEDNKEWEDRLISGYLYGGDIENRIRQEIMLGIGGTRLLERLKIKPSIYHMNEGHSGFLIFERVREIMSEKKQTFETAIKIAKENLVFTNHTLKQAGNDIFDFMLFEKYLLSYANELNLDINDMFNFGYDKSYSQGGFSMTVFCLRNATVSTSVSKLHGKAAEALWKENPLIPVTNGVHLPTWISPEIHILLDEYVGENWHLSMENLDYDGVQKIPSKKLWDAHIIRKRKLINSLNNVLGLELREDVLTIAWSRRLAAYKRPDLIITDIERLKRIVSNAERPIQILIAGKSHPKDTIGKQILQKINQSFSDEFFKNKIEVIPGYNWQLARRIVSGADIWLNTPYRYEEACGTSGMKAAANGALQFTTLDGWTDEVNWYKIGWVISENNSAESLYDTLENQIAPLFYTANQQGFNDDWTEMMRNSIELILKDFSSERMLMDYLNNIYTKLLL